jgi:hypothetical protein
MRKFALTAVLGAACLGLAACSGGGEGNADGNNAAGAEGEGNGGEAGGEGNGASSGGAGGNTASSSNWPRGARIVQENGATFRVDPDGTRVRLADTDARIVVENGVRYRVDPGGTRVRINDRGIDVDVDTPDIDLPDVDVGVNNKGNLDVDVGDRDPDGGR